MPSRKTAMFKDRVKNLKNIKQVSYDISNDIDAKIAQINSRIKNCELDLKGMFRDNSAILNKLIVLKETKANLELKRDEMLKEQIKEKETTLDQFGITKENYHNL